MKSDFRNTKYCIPLENVHKKKDALKEKICKEHPRARIIYKQVRDRSKSYKKEFMKIYNDKCGYCGNSISNISELLLEVDHYICESFFASEEDAGKMSNLVLACYDCNRSKGKLLIEGRYVGKLNPDNEEIQNVFCRDTMYYIRVAEKYKEDGFITHFYEELKLGYQTKRLDYLLMNMRGLCKKVKGKPQAEKLYEMLIKLQEKRNRTGGI
jgi:5-methylcytosine-specific restriction endonuclease McrA